MNRAVRGVYTAAAAACVLAAGLTACDSVQAPPAVDARPPAVAAFGVSPSVVSVDTLAVVEGEVAIPLAIELEARPGDAPIQRVAYAVQWQFECAPGALELTGEMDPVEGNRYVVAPELHVPPGRRGAYRVTAWAVDLSGIHSNEVSATFQVTGTNQGPPVIDRIEAPTQLSPPGQLRFVAHVSDPDGVDHIARAEVDLPGAGTFPMADTDTAGNNTACDGTYSITFSVGQATEPGNVVFTFRAFDREGAVSDDLPFTVEILE